MDLQGWTTDVVGVILPDTSAWIEYDRATGSPSHLRIRDHIRDELPLATTEPVVMELLAGARFEAQGALSRLLARATLLPFQTPTDFDGAAEIYRRCRRAGVTPRGLVDCMIAHVALRSGVAVLSNDVDFARVAAVVGVVLDEASLKPAQL